MSIHSWLRTTAAKAGIATVALASTVVAPLGSAGTHAAQATAPVTITYWAQNIALPKDIIPAFERTHPGIKVKEVVVTNYNTKVRIMFKAGGSSAPDALQMQYNELPSYLLTGKLLDLSAYGANSLKRAYVPWVWGQVARGSHVYAIPVDSGPMAMMYRKDIFDKYHLAIPTTWTQYAQEAVTLHKANPKIWMGNSPVDEYDFDAFVWQAGGRPFTVNGTTVSINVDSPAALKVATYWYTLIKEKAVDTLPSYTPSWYTSLDKGTFATWINAAWAPLILQPVAKKSLGKWRVTQMPQWTAGANASANYGGSSEVVTTYSTHPKEAAIFAEWLGGAREAQLINLKNHIFPTLNSILDDPKQMNQPDPFFGGQASAAVFAQASKGVNESWQFSPFDDYVSAQEGNDLAAAEAGKSTFAGALHKMQTSVVTYAKAQGFTVK